MHELKLVSEIPPSVNHYLAYRAIIKDGRPMAVSYNTQESVRFKKRFAEYVNEEVILQGWDLTPNSTQHFYADAVFYFPRVDMDANNYWKVLLDAISDTKKIWIDDNVVCERVQAIYYDSARPRIELTIHPVDYIGVFQNAPQLEEFESGCVGCSRYTRNCSILRGAKEGRIQENIENGACIKNKNKKNRIKGEAYEEDICNKME